MKIARLSLALCLILGAGACGQKGPLVLPDAKPKHKPLVIPGPKAPKTPAKPQDAPAPAPADAGPATGTVPAAPSPGAPTPR